MNLRDVPNLDFVRSIAVISVVVEHSLLAMGITEIGPFRVQYLGVLGVLVFFVLTSLVLMWSLDRKPHALDFYIRRCFRIYPLALAALAAALLFHAPTGGTAEDYFVYCHPSAVLVLFQAALISVTSRPLLSVIWSLPYEMEMYLLLPMLFFFLRRNFAIWPLSLVWLLVIVNTFYLPSSGHNFAVAIGYFLPGVMAYVGFGRWKPSLPAWILPIFLCGMWAIFWHDFDYHRGWEFCLIVGLMLPLFRQFKSEIVLTPSRVIAKYSYGIYLTHPFAIVIGFYLLRNYSFSIRLVGELVPLIALPIIAYHLIEHPMIRYGSRVAAKLEKKYEQRNLSEARQ